MDHECDSPPAWLKVAFTVGGSLFYHEANYCCGAAIPAPEELLPAGAQITEVSLYCDGVETTVSRGQVTVIQSVADALGA